MLILKVNAIVEFDAEFALKIAFFLVFTMEFTLRYFLLICVRGSKGRKLLKNKSGLALFCMAYFGKRGVLCIKSAQISQNMLDKKASLSLSKLIRR